MIKKILSGYAKLFVSAGKAAALVVLCAAFGCIVVLPLWKFAVSAPDAYSLAVLIIIAGSAVFFIGRKIHTYIYMGITDKAEKKMRIRRLLLTLLQITVCVSGAAGIIALILHEMKAAALIILLFTVIIYGILAFGLRKDTRNR